jgi:hypothetical protein
MSTRVLLTALAFGFTVVGVGLNLVFGAQTTAQERFDNLVRADFFAGLAGDAAALERAIRLTEATLAQDPRHAEALVWHGSGLLFLAGQSFEKGDLVKGAALWERGLKEMDEAVGLQPDNVGVLIPRGATLLEASRTLPIPARSRELLARGVADYEEVLRLQEPYFGMLPVHAKGELLFGLAEGTHRLGQTDAARGHFIRLLNETKGSPYESKAAEWLKGTPSAKSSAASPCVGCHTKP